MSEVERATRRGRIVGRLRQAAKGAVVLGAVGGAAAAGAVWAGAAGDDQGPDGEMAAVMAAAMDADEPYAWRLVAPHVLRNGAGWEVCDEVTVVAPNGTDLDGYVARDVGPPAGDPWRWVAHRDVWPLAEPTVVETAVTGDGVDGHDPQCAPLDVEAAEVVTGGPTLREALQERK